MAYSNYHIQLALYLGAIIVDTVAITILALQGVELVALLIPFIVLVALVVGIMRLIHFPIKQVKTFLLSIRCNERMLRMPIVKDRMLKEMYDNMNEILTHYHENESLIETKKMYYDRILRIMTHEIRNTITPIITLSDYYIHNSVSLEEADIKDGMTIINNQSKNIKSFLDSYHTLTHLPQPDPIKLSMLELFEEMFKLFEKEFPNVKLLVHTPDICIYADPSGIRMVLSNLLRNAMESASSFKDGCVELRATQSADSSLIMITDNGGGIQQSHIEDIFLPFYTTKENGNGIGLSLSRQIMKLHGGELYAESCPESRFTTFTMKFYAP